MTSPELTVAPTDDLQVTEVQVRAEDVLVRAGYPKPDPAVSFRERAAGPTTGTVEVTAPDGTVSTVVGLYDSSLRAYVVPVAVAGGAVRVPAGGLADGFGNTNG